MEEQKTNQPEGANTPSPVASEAAATPVASVVEKQTGTPGVSTTTIAVVGLVIVVILAGVYWLVGRAEEQGLTLTPAGQLTSENNYPEVVAVVNGEELPRDDFMLSLQQEARFAAGQGVDVNDPAVSEAIETAAVDRLINTVLLVQSAVESGITITPEAVEEELARISAQFPSAEAFEAALTDGGMTAELLRENIADQLLIDTFLGAQESIANTPEVTAEEIEARYNEVIALQPDLPPLEEVSDAIVEQLSAEKQQEAVGAFIDELRAQAEVEVTL